MRRARMEEKERDRNKALYVQCIYLHIFNENMFSGREKHSHDKEEGWVAVTAQGSVTAWCGLQWELREAVHVYAK